MNEILHPSFNIQELGLEEYSDIVNQIAIWDLKRGIKRFNPNSSCVNIGECIKVDRAPLFSVGAYSCYVGLARNHTGLYLFHYRKNTSIQNVMAQVRNAKEIIFGRAFQHEDSNHWMESLNTRQLPVRPFQSVNLALIPGDMKLYYSYGVHRFIDGYES